MAVAAPACDRPLIVRLRNWVGDVVLGVPALRLLEQHGYRLQLLGRRWAPALLAGQRWDIQVQPTPLRERVAQLRRLRATALARDAGFAGRDNALVLPTSFSSALEMRLAGLRAVGYAAEARGLLLSRSEPAPVDSQHMLARYWNLACRLLDIECTPPASIGLAIGEAQLACAERLLAQHGVAPGFIVLCPFAGGTFEHSDKTWPGFPALTASLRALARPLLSCPGPGEESIIRDLHPGVMLLEGVDLGSYAAILSRAALVVSNDTGPAHLAAAVGAPVLSVLGPTRPEQWAPWGPQVQVLRHWPRWPTVDEAMAMVAAQLAAGRTG